MIRRVGKPMQWFADPFFIVSFAIGSGLFSFPTSMAQSLSDSAKVPGVSVSNENWSRFLGAGFDGSVLSNPASINWQQEPTPQWDIEVGDGYGIASVAGGRVYQCDSIGGSRFASGSERLRCFDLSSGDLIWEHAQPINYRDLYGYEAGPRSSPTVVGGKVFTFGVTGQLTCRAVGDGRSLWSTNTSETYGVVQNFFGVGAAPLVINDLVIVMVGGSPPEDQSIPPGQLDRVVSNGSALVAFDINTGKERWKSGEDLASYSSPRAVQLGGVKAVLIFARNGLIAVEAQSGKRLWRFDHRASILESVNGMMPIVKGDKVFISECYQLGSVLLGVDDKSAKVIWQDDRRSREKSMRSHWSTPVLVGDYLYGCSGRNAPDSDFRCVEFSTGKVQWVDPRRTRSSVTRWGDHLIVMEERGVLEVLKANPKTMEVVTRVDLSVPGNRRPALQFPCWSAPVLVGNRMLLRGDQHVICLQWQTK